MKSDEPGTCTDCRPVFSRFCDDAPDFEHVELCPKHAAAPELLGALRILMESTGALRGNPDTDNVAERAARAAIAKAEGRA